MTLALPMTFGLWMALSVIALSFPKQAELLDPKSSIPWAAAGAAVVSLVVAGFMSVHAKELCKRTTKWLWAAVAGVLWAGEMVCVAHMHSEVRQHALPKTSLWVGPISFLGVTWIEDTLPLQRGPTATQRTALENRRHRWGVLATTAAAIVIHASPWDTVELPKKKVLLLGCATAVLRVARLLVLKKAVEGPALRVPFVGGVVFTLMLVAALVLGGITGWMEGTPLIHRPWLPYERLAPIPAAALHGVFLVANLGILQRLPTASMYVLVCMGRDTLALAYRCALYDVTLDTVAVVASALWSLLVSWWWVHCLFQFFPGSDLPFTYLQEVESLDSLSDIDETEVKRCLHTFQMDEWKRVTEQP